MNFDEINLLFLTSIFVVYFIHFSILFIELYKSFIVLALLSNTF